jgi:hypothetical protein
VEIIDPLRFSDCIEMNTGSASAKKPFHQRVADKSGSRDTTTVKNIQPSKTPNTIK